MKTNRIQKKNFHKTITNRIILFKFEMLVKINDEK